MERLASTHDELTPYRDEALVKIFVAASSLIAIVSIFVAKDFLVGVNRVDFTLIVGVTGLTTFLGVIVLVSAKALGYGSVYRWWRAIRIATFLFSALSVSSVLILGLKEIDSRSCTRRALTDDPCPYVDGPFQWDDQEPSGLFRPYDNGREWVNDPNDTWGDGR